MRLTKEDALEFTENKGLPCPKDSSVKSVRNSFRVRVAREQAQLAPVSCEQIILYTNEYLIALGMRPSIHPVLTFSEESSDKEIALYVKKKIYLPLEREYGTAKNLVWLKFTSDGYLGVVAGSDDINFEIPSDDADTLAKYTTAGIIIKELGKTWDRRFVLKFPLVNIPSGLSAKRIEAGIGNYLISRGVPILDFYSHRFFNR